MKLPVNVNLDSKSMMKKLFKFGWISLVLLPSQAYAQRTVFNNPLSEDPEKLTSPAVLVGRIVQAILSISATLALVMVIYGGVQIAFGMKAGNDGQLGSGRKTILFAILGLIVAISGFLVVDIILGALDRF